MRTTRFIALLVATLAFVACEQLPTDAPPDSNPLLAKGGGKGKPGGGGGGSGGGDPVNPTILFTNPIGGKLGYTLFLMDDSGAMRRVLGDSEEHKVENVDPRWAPDASRFLVKRSFYVKRVGWTPSQLWIADGDGSDLSMVLDGVPGSARWLGVDRIVFIDSGGDLVVTDLDGSQVDQLTATGDVQSLIASPDGSQILAEVADGQAVRLYGVSCAPCVVTGETEISGADLGLSGQDFYPVDWGHTADRVLLSVHVGWGNSDISVLDLAGPTPTVSPLVVSAVDEYNAAWSHDDSRVVFARFPSASDSRKAGIVIRELVAGSENEVATSVGPMGIDWRPTAPASQ